MWWYFKGKIGNAILAFYVTVYFSQTFILSSHLVNKSFPYHKEIANFDDSKLRNNPWSVIKC